MDLRYFSQVVILNVDCIESISYENEMVTISMNSGNSHEIKLDGIDFDTYINNIIKWNRTLKFFG